MVRMRASKIAAALGVIIAFAMTPRAALAVDYQEFLSPPLAVFQPGSAPGLLEPSQVLTGTNSSVTSPIVNGSLSNIDGNYSNRKITDNITYSTSNQDLMFHNYKYIFGGYHPASPAITTNQNLYLDIYFATTDIKEFPPDFKYQVCLPSYVRPIVDQNGSTSQDYSSYLDFMGVRPLVVDSVKCHRQRIQASTSVWEWVDVPRTSTASMYFPYSSKMLSGTVGIDGFVVRCHFNTGSYFPFSGEWWNLYIAMDGLSMRYVMRDNDITNAINGASDGDSAGEEPLSTTVINSTNRQTNTLMDTNGSEEIVNGLTGGGKEGFIEKLGFVAQIPQMVSGFFDAILNAPRNTSVHFPGVVVLGYTLIPEQDVEILQNGLGNAGLLNSVRWFVTFAFFIAWVNGMKRLLEHQLLGEAYDPTEDV